MKFLEIFKTDRFQDISLNQVSTHPSRNFELGQRLTVYCQWLALTPPDLVKAHLNLDDATIAKLSKTKPTVIGPSGGNSTSGN